MKTLQRLFVINLVFIFSFSCLDRQRKEPIERIYSCSDSSDLANYPKNFIKRESTNDYLVHPDLKDKFSVKSLNLANAYGMIPLLKKLIKIRKEEESKKNSTSSSLEFNRLKLRINASLEFASIDISGSASEMHCYAERMSDFIRILQNKERDSIKNYTLVSLMIAASFTIMSGAVQWQSDTLQSAVNFIGGFSSGYFGYQATTYETQTEFVPEKKVLSEFWYANPESSVFSDPLWYLINHKPDRDQKENSLREELIKHWIEADYLGEKDTEKRELAISTFFRSERKHSIDDLMLIREMNRQIGVAIQLTLQDIKLLDREIDLQSENQLDKEE